ncbi:anion permease [Candidatus Fermentibacteria bacterium]|nr:anion permease [Candidatus Fermentibacteria bacterium]
MTTQGIVFSICFVCIYGYVAFANNWRGAVVWLGAMTASMISFALGAPPDLRVFLTINYNVLLIFAGILIVAEILIETRVPEYLAAKLIRMAGTYGKAGVLICALSGIISIFVENVATVMIVAPIALEATRRLKVSPVPLLIGIAVASNLQGTATLVGDPPSMILAASENMGFNDFFFFHGKPGIFFAVQAGAVASFFVLYFIFGRDKSPVSAPPLPEVTSWVPTAILGIVIAGLAVISLFTSGVGLAAGSLCAAGAVITLVWHATAGPEKGWILRVRLRPDDHEIEGREQARSAWDIVKGFDFDTLFLLAGIFFMVNSLESYGVMQRIGAIMASWSGNDPFTAFMLVVWGSVLISGVVDNVPYVTAMIPVVRALGVALGVTDYYFLTFGLLVGACLGGNISPVGASANIVATGILKRRGYRVTFFRFASIGFPFTIAATVAGAAFVWLVWGP